MKKSNLIFVVRNLIFFVLTVNFSLLTFHCYAQDIHYVNQDLSKTLLNPSYVGINDHDFIAGIIYRDQWSQFGRIYRTYAFSSEFLLNSSKRSGGNLGLGVWFDRDNAGLVRVGTNQLGLSLAYHGKIAEGHIFSGGIYGGMLNKHLSQENMQWDSQYNGSYYDASMSSNENIGYYSYTKPDVGAGISYMYNHKRNNEGQIFQAGIAMYHLNKPDMSFTSTGGDKLYQRLVINTSGIIDIPLTMVSLNPAISYMQQGSSREMLISLRSIFDITKSNLKGSNIQSAWLGLHARTKDAMIIELGVKTHDVAISFSYDWTLWSIQTKGTDAFELGLIYSKSIFKNKGSKLL